VTTWTVKTLINIILGVISYAIMWFMGVDFALFWAVAIALMNYDPLFRFAHRRDVACDAVTRAVCVDLDNISCWRRC